MSRMYLKESSAVAKQGRFTSIVVHMIKQEPSALRFEFPASCCGK